MFLFVAQDLSSLFTPNVRAHLRGGSGKTRGHQRLLCCLRTPESRSLSPVKCSEGLARCSKVDADLLISIPRVHILSKFPNHLMGEKYIHVAFLYRIAFFVCMLNAMFSHALKKSPVNFGFVVFNLMALL